MAFRVSKVADLETLKGDRAKQCSTGLEWLNSIIIVIELILSLWLLTKNHFEWTID